MKCKGVTKICWQSEKLHRKEIQKNTEEELCLKGCYAHVYTLGQHILIIIFSMCWQFFLKCTALCIDLI